jgi:Family of unknown function (DUF6519)
MNGDISRITFSPVKHFTSVLLQQGRVQMDADWNEQSAILSHYLRSLAADLIGQHGGPDDLFDDDKKELLKRNCGFGIITASSNMLATERKLLDPTSNTLLITAGHYYVDGLLCESENPWHYSEQPYRKQENDNEIKSLTKAPFFLYLDVWERLVTALEDPTIREVALGGADTAARTKLIWQVKVQPIKISLEPIKCEAFNKTWFERILPELQRENRGRLSAKAKEVDPGSQTNPCITSPEARYRGMENQLYRVEIHQGGPALNKMGANQEEAATFKWSRDNATIRATLKRKEGDRLIVNGLRDFSRWFRAGEWVEITHDALELNGEPGTLVRLARVEGETLTIDPYTTSGKIYEPGSKSAHPAITNLEVRRWDQKQPEDGLLKDGAILIEADKWIELEDGVMIKFEPGPPAAQYRTGDYWLIPARTSTGDVEWPKMFVDPKDDKKKIELPEPLPPHGVVHHYAPLAIVTPGPDQLKIVDLRHKFPPLGTC